MSDFFYRIGKDALDATRCVRLFVGIPFRTSRLLYTFVCFILCAVS